MADDDIKLPPRALVITVIVAVGLGATLTIAAVKYFSGAPAGHGPAPVAASIALPDDENIRIHRESLGLLHAIERRDRAVCLMLADYTNAKPAVLELCR